MKIFCQHVTDAREGMVELIVEGTKSKTRFRGSLNPNQPGDSNP
jgi:hypothetical protein